MDGQERASMSDILSERIPASEPAASTAQEPASSEPAGPAQEPVTEPAGQQAAEPSAAPAKPSDLDRVLEEQRAWTDKLQRENQELRTAQQKALDNQTQLMQRLTDHLTRENLTPEQMQATLAKVYEEINSDPKGFVQRESAAQIKKALEEAGVSGLAEQLKETKQQLAQLESVRLEQTTQEVLRDLAGKGFEEISEKTFLDTMLAADNVDAVVKRFYPNLDRKNDEAGKRALVVDPIFYERLYYAAKSKTPAAAPAATGQPVAAQPITDPEVAKLQKVAQTAATQARSQGGSQVQAKTLTQAEQLMAQWKADNGKQSMRTVLK